jgi:phosphoglycolate phosphatase
MTVNKAKVSAVLFDLDGTLLDTADDLGAALNYVLQQHGLATVTPERYRPIASDGANGLLSLGFAEQITHFNHAQLREQFLTYYQQNIAKHTCLYPGVAELLNEIEHAGIPWGIITNKPAYLTKLLLPHFNEFKHCAVMLGGDSLPERKPHPLPMQVACKTLNVQTNQCVYIGDAIRDIEAGNNAQMKTCIASWGYIKAYDDIYSWQADAILASPLALIEHLF